MVKADITSDSGVFTFERLKPGRYFAEASYIGMTNFTTEVFEMNDKPVILVPIILTENAKQLEEVVVTATRSLVETI